MQRLTIIAKHLFIPTLFFILTVIYLWPLLEGLVVLPLDLLVSSYSPWYSAGTILLKNPYMQDSVVQYIPWRHLTFTSLMYGFIPLWNPYQFLGSPFMANLKSMVFYPLNIFFIFGEIRAWNLLLFSQIFLGFIFAYLLARELSLRKVPSILVAFAFSLNSYMIGLLEFGSDAQTVIWWPLLLLSIKKYIDKKDIRYLLIFPITLAFSLFAGQLQYIGYFLIILFCFTFYYGFKQKISLMTYVTILFAFILGLGLSSVQLMPAIELFKFSHRGLLAGVQAHQVFSKGLMPSVDLLRLLSADFFGNPVTRDLRIAYIETSGYFGIIPFFFTLLAILFERKNTFVKFFSVAFILSVLFSLQGFGELLYYLKIPLITSGSAERIFVIVLFSGAILSGFGFTYFLSKKDYAKKLMSTVTFLILTVLSIGIYHIFHKNETTFIHNVTFSSLILGIFTLIVVVWYFAHRVVKREKIIVILFCSVVLILTYIDLFRFGYRFLTFSNEKFFYPNTSVVQYIQKDSQQSLGRTYGLAEPEISTYLHLYTADTYNPLYLLRTAVLLQALQGKLGEKPSFDNKYFLTADGQALKRSMDFLGITYIVVGKYENPSSKYFHTQAYEKSLKQVYEDDKYIVYQNLDSSPRFAIFYKVQVIPNDTKMLSRLSQWSDSDKDTIFLEEKLSTPLKNGTGSAKLLNNMPDNQTFQVTSSTNALFYISDTFFPGWSVTVNGKSEKIYQANYNFRAVLIPKGNSVIKFTYLPLSFIAGIIVSCISLFILLVIAAYSLMKMRIK